MSKVCILTDSTAQFPTPVFPGCELVNIIPLHVEYKDVIYTDGKDIRTANLPASSRHSNGPRALPPTEEEFHQIFSNLGRRYREIITILVSSHLNPVVSMAHTAATSVRGPATVHIIDSQTTAVGLGLLVQAAAKAAQSGSDGVEITRLVRGLVSKIYTVFCVQSLSYLYRSGHLDPAQAIIGEMLNVMPFLILENGRLVPIQKVRSSRHLVDILHEFITEFSNLNHIAIVQGVPPFEQEARNLRDRVNGEFPSPTPSFSEHTLGAALATILGPRSLGVVVWEKTVDD
jgi:DegV family protein with EDD domain